MPKAMLIFILLFPIVTDAAIYKCDKNGKVEFSDSPCSANSEVIEQPKIQKISDDDSWDFVRSTDDMTGNVTCLALSPQIYVGSDNGDFYFATLRAGYLKDDPIVAISSESGFGDRPASFHNDISGLGLKVGDSEFFPVNSRPSSHVLGYSQSAAKEIIGALDTGAPFRVRLRYWPYERTFDSDPTGNNGFARAFRQLQACAGVD